jgi:TPR repeat protein
LKLASDSDHPTAMFELAKFYIEGYGIPKDEEKAMKLLIRSSELGEPSAQFLLGLIYQVGRFGLEQNERESLNWFMKSAKLNNAEAQLKVGDAYLDGNLLSKDVEKSFEYWTKAAENNNIEAMKRLRIFYIDGLDEVEPNLEQAFYWTKKAAELDDCESQSSLGCDFLSGTTGHTDFDEAYLWLKIAADKGDKVAQYGLGIMYKRGLCDGEIDIVNAREWFSKAAEQGLQQAIDELGMIDFPTLKED